MAGCNSTHVARARRSWRNLLRRDERRKASMASHEELGKNEGPMNVAQLKELIADLPDDMPVVFRPWGSWAQPIAGIHILPYDKHRRLIADGEEPPPSTEQALVLNPYHRPD